jgi:hypothetical protein
VRRLRYALAAVGGAVTALALVLAIDPSAAAVVRADGLVELLGNDYLLVAPLGALAVLTVLAVLVARAREGVDQASPPDPERVPTAPHPGNEVDQLADDGLGLRARLFSNDDDRIRERLRRTAIRTVMRSDDCSREAARNRVDSGDWTDDSAAVDFLAGRDGLSWRSRIAAAVRGESAFQHGLRRAATAIAVRSGESIYANGGERSNDEETGDRS